MSDTNPTSATVRRGRTRAGSVIPNSEAIAASASSDSSNPIVSDRQALSTHQTLPQASSSDKRVSTSGGQETAQYVGENAKLVYNSLSNFSFGQEVSKLGASAATKFMTDAQEAFENMNSLASASKSPLKDTTGKVVVSTLHAKQGSTSPLDGKEGEFLKRSSPVPMALSPSLSAKDMVSASSVSIEDSSDAEHLVKAITPAMASQSTNASPSLGSTNASLSSTTIQGSRALHSLTLRKNPPVPSKVPKTLGMTNNAPALATPAAAPTAAISTDAPAVASAASSKIKTRRGSIAPGTTSAPVVNAPDADRTPVRTALNSLQRSPPQPTAPAAQPFLRSLQRFLPRQPATAASSAAATADAPSVTSTTATGKAPTCLLCTLLLLFVLLPVSLYGLFANDFMHQFVPVEVKTSLSAAYISSLEGVQSVLSSFTTHLPALDLSPETYDMHDSTANAAASAPATPSLAEHVRVENRRVVVTKRKPGSASGQASRNKFAATHPEPAEAHDDANAPVAAPPEACLHSDSAVDAGSVPEVVVLGSTVVDTAAQEQLRALQAKMATLEASVAKFESHVTSLESQLADKKKNKPRDKTMDMELLESKLKRITNEFRPAIENLQESLVLLSETVKRESMQSADSMTRLHAQFTRVDEELERAFFALDTYLTLFAKQEALDGLEKRFASSDSQINTLSFSLDAMSKRHKLLVDQVAELQTLAARWHSQLTDTEIHTTRLDTLSLSIEQAMSNMEILKQYLEENAGKLEAVTTDISDLQTAVHITIPSDFAEQRKAAFAELTKELLESVQMHQDNLQSSVQLSETTVLALVNTKLGAFQSRLDELESRAQGESSYRTVKEAELKDSQDLVHAFEEQTATISKNLTEVQAKLSELETRFHELNSHPGGTAGSGEASTASSDSSNEELRRSLLLELQAFIADTVNSFLRDFSLNLENSVSQRVKLELTSYVNSQLLHLSEAASNSIRAELEQIHRDMLTLESHTSSYWTEMFTKQRETWEQRFLDLESALESRISSFGNDSEPGSNGATSLEVLEQVETIRTAQETLQANVDSYVQTHGAALDAAKHDLAALEQKAQEKVQEITHVLHNLDQQMLELQVRMDSLSDSVYAKSGVSSEDVATDSIVSTATTSNEESRKAHKRGKKSEEDMKSVDTQDSFNSLNTLVETVTADVASLRTMLSSLDSTVHTALAEYGANFVNLEARIAEARDASDTSSFEERFANIQESVSHAHTTIVQLEELISAYDQRLERILSERIPEAVQPNAQGTTPENLHEIITSVQSEVSGSLSALKDDWIALETRISATEAELLGRMESLLQTLEESKSSVATLQETLQASVDVHKSSNAGLLEFLQAKVQAAEPSSDVDTLDLVYSKQTAATSQRLQDYYASDPFESATWNVVATPFTPSTNAQTGPLSRSVYKHGFSVDGISPPPPSLTVTPPETPLLPPVTVADMAKSSKELFAPLVESVLQQHLRSYSPEVLASLSEQEQSFLAGIASSSAQQLFATLFAESYALGVSAASQTMQSVLEAQQRQFASLLTSFAATLTSNAHQSFESALSLYSIDAGVPKVDYALSLNGGKIMFHLTSAQWNANNSTIGFPYSAGLAIRSQEKHPHSSCWKLAVNGVLTDATTPADSQALVYTNETLREVHPTSQIHLLRPAVPLGAGLLSVFLNSPKVLTAITLEYTHPLLRPSCPEGTAKAPCDIGSAPKVFSVWGLLKGPQRAFLGRFQYDPEGPPVQTFFLNQTAPGIEDGASPFGSTSQVLEEGEFTHGVFGLVQLQVESTWGDSNYACIQRFRIHGE